MRIPNDWWIEGTYFEACNCAAVCPCRQQGDRPGGRSTFGTCDFALFRIIDRGETDDLELAGIKVVMTGRYDDDEPGSPWRVAVYIDERQTQTSSPPWPSCSWAGQGAPR